MSGYSVGENVELDFVIGSTQSTAPESATVDLVVKAPSAVYGTLYGGLDMSTPPEDSTGTGWARWSKLIEATEPGRWTYQFRSTGTVVTSMGGAFAVAAPLASTGMSS